MRDGQVIIIRHTPRGTYVPNIDPKTRKASADPQQFIWREGGRLEILPRAQWIDNPDVVDVPAMAYL